MSTLMECPLCAGAGRFDDIECPQCDRVGLVARPDGAADEPATVRPAAADETSGLAAPSSVAPAARPEAPSPDQGWAVYAVVFIGGVAAHPFVVELLELVFHA